MIASRRWQDWTTTLIGALVAISPFVYGTGLSTTATFEETAATCTAIGMGGLIFVAGLATLAFPRAAWLEVVQVVFAVILFVAPWILGFTGLAAMAWTAYIGGIAVAGIAGSRLFTAGPQLTPTS